MVVIGANVKGVSGFAACVGTDRPANEMAKNAAHARKRDKKSGMKMAKTAANRANVHNVRCRIGLGVDVDLVIGLRLI
jgi:hypothetical protein